MNRMKILRDRENMTGTKLARKVGVTPSMIYMVENGQKNPSIMLAYRIAQALNASVEEVFFCNGCNGALHNGGLARKV
jgi:putative transcriptional regulator